MGKKFKNAGTFTPNFSYTYPGKLSEEIFVKPKIDVPALSDFATIKNGIRSGEYMNLWDLTERILTKGTSTCTPTYTTVGTITDRQITTGLFEVNIEWCKKQFQGLLNTPNLLGDSSLVGDGLSGYELGGKLRTMIFNSVTEQMKLDLWKVLLFGDNSLGSGSTNVFSTIDGVWTKFFDSFGSYCIKPISNAFPNAHNSTLSAGQGLEVIKQVYNNAPRLLKSLMKTEKVFWVTDSVYENIYDSYLDDCCVDLSWKAQQDGIDTLRYKGIAIRPLTIADETLENDSDNPFYDEIRHFIIYTTPKNHIFGFENASDIDNLELCYDCKNKTSLIQGEFRAGYQFIHCDYAAIAY